MIRNVYWHGKTGEGPDADNYAYCPLCGGRLAAEMIDHRPRMACPACGFIHFRNPAPTVSLMIVKGEQVLLGRRAEPPEEGCWATPSGYIEMGEDFITTAVREAKEETGLDITVTAILNVTDSFFPPHQHFFNVYLLANPAGGKLRAGDDMTELAWFPLTGPLPDMAFIEDTDMIEGFRKGCPVLPCLTMRF